ncbi:MAG: YihY/virulence factor BrkB family protein [Myxococcota bacterium]
MSEPRVDGPVAPPAPRAGVVKRLLAVVARPFEFVKGIYEYLDDHDWGIYCAGLSFYALISLTPLVVLAVFIGGTVFGSEVARGELYATVMVQAGPQVADFVIDFAKGAADLSSLSLASVFGFFVLLWSSTNLFTQVRSALHAMWGIAPERTKRLSVGASILKFLRQRAFAAIGTLVFGALFIALLALRVALSVVEKGTSEFLALPFWFWDIADLVVALVLITVFVRVVYRLLAARSPTGKGPWIGALVTAILLVLGRSGLVLYLSVGTVGSAYGAAAALVIFLGWAYWSAFAFLFGARLSYVLACRWGAWKESPMAPLGEAEAAPMLGPAPARAKAKARAKARPKAKVAKVGVGSGR